MDAELIIKNAREVASKEKNIKILLFIIILLLGLALRLFQLGKVSFWYDEAGVAMAVASNTIDGVFQVVRTHAMAMPLDYLVAWLIARVSLSEGWLRLPAALWGSATLAVAFFLFRKLTDEKTAFISMLFLAISYIHIEYSQELRFYASMVFFYLLVTYLLFNAIQDSNLKNWIWVVVVAIVGVYFHLFVILAFANGLFWLVFLRKKLAWRTPAWRGYGLASLLVVLALLPGYLYFCSNITFIYGFDPKSIAVALLASLGWVLIFDPTKSLLWLEITLILNLIGGVMAILRRYRVLVALSISFACQVGIILAGCILKHYFLVPRQFLMYLPFAYLFAAWALVQLFQSPWAVKKESSKPGNPNNLPVRQINRGIATVVLLACLASSVPALATYYHFIKSTAREVSQTLASEWKPGDKVWAVPDWEPLLFRFYLEKRMNNANLASVFEGKDWPDLDQIPASFNKIYLIIPDYVSLNEFEHLKSLGFHQDPSQVGAPIPAHILMVLKKN